MSQRGRDTETKENAKHRDLSVDLNKQITMLKIYRPIGGQHSCRSNILCCPNENIFVKQQKITSLKFVLLYREKKYIYIEREREIREMKHACINVLNSLLFFPVVQKGNLLNRAQRTEKQEKENTRCSWPLLDSIHACQLATIHCHYF